MNDWNGEPQSDYQRLCNLYATLRLEDKTLDFDEFMLEHLSQDDPEYKKHLLYSQKKDK